MAKTTEPKQERAQKRIPPLPGGIRQHREGIRRCGVCGAEVVIVRTIDGILVEVSPVLAERHVCPKEEESIGTTAR